MNEDIDVGIRSLLVTLDPERTDPGYWHRFHRWVVTSAVGELAKRRRREATVSEVIFSWWCTVVPSATVAAALASRLVRPGPSARRAVSGRADAGHDDGRAAAGRDGGAGHAFLRDG